jgi:hypothetical protein
MISGTKIARSQIAKIVRLGAASSVTSFTSKWHWKEYAEHSPPGVKHRADLA